MAPEDQASADRVAIAGSEREPEPGHPRVGDPDLASVIEVSVYLREASPLDWVDAEAARPVAEQRRLSRQELANAHGATEADVNAVRAFAVEYGSRWWTATLGGAASRSAARFVTSHARLGCRARLLLTPKRRDISRTARAAHGACCAGGRHRRGIRDRPAATGRSHLRRRPRKVQATSYTPVQVAQAYDFPSGPTGAGETVAVIELGGGFSEADLSTYFTTLGLPAPTVTAVGVDGGSNSPGVNQDSDGEVMLDIEVIGAVAPGASIVAYFAVNTDQGFLDAVSTAVHDTTHNPSVISISWAGLRTRGQRRHGLRWSRPSPRPPRSRHRDRRRRRQRFDRRRQRWKAAC